jgi:hypothetical protein
MITDAAIKAATAAFIEHGTLLEALEAATAHITADDGDSCCCGVCGL